MLKMKIVGKRNEKRTMRMERTNVINIKEENESKKSNLSQIREETGEGVKWIVREVGKTKEENNKILKKTVEKSSGV